jgi:hypothetical protein
MSRKEIPDSAIEIVAQHINNRSSKNYGINAVGNEANIETPQIFEIHDQPGLCSQENALRRRKSSLGCFASCGRQVSRECHYSLQPGLLCVSTRPAKDARNWLVLAFSLGKELKQLAFDEPDLEPLWLQIGKI